MAVEQFRLAGSRYMKNRNNAIVTIEEIKEIIDRRNLESQINDGFDDQQKEHSFFENNK